AGAHAGHHLRLVPGTHPPELDACPEVGRERGVQLAQIWALVAGEKEDKTRAVELPVGPKDLDRQIPRADYVGRGPRRVLLHALVLVHREEIRAVRFAHDGAEGWVDHHERRVRRKDGHACRILSELGPHDDELVEIDVGHAPRFEEIHAAGLHEASADDRARRDHAAARAKAAAYGRRSTRSSSNIRALTFDSTTSRRHRSSESARSTSSR